MLKFKYLGMNLIILYFLSLPLQPILTSIFSNILLYICIFFSLFKMVAKKKISLTKFDIFFVCFFIFAGCSVFYSHQLTGTGYALRKLIPAFLFGFTSAQYLNDFSRNDKIYFFKKLFILYSFVVFLISFYLVIFELPKLGGWGHLGSKLYKDIGLTIFTYHLCFAMDFCIFLFITSKKKGIKALCALEFIVMLICSYNTSVRKVIISPFLFILITLLIKNRRHFLSILKYTLIMLTIFLIAYYIMINNEDLYIVIGRRVESLVADIIGISTKSSYIDLSKIERYRLRDNAIELFKQYPITGYGLDAFKFYTVQHGTSQLYSHNNYLELLACTGLIGFSLYYGAIMSLLMNLRKKLNENPMLISLISILLVQLFLDAGSVTYYSEIYISFYFFVSSFMNDKKNQFGG